METLFVNQYYRTAEVDKEIYKVLYLQRISIYLYFGYMLLLGIIMYILYGIFPLILVLVIILAYCIALFFGYRKTVKTSCKRTEETLGPNPLMYIEIAADQIRTFGPRGYRGEYNYYQLKKVIQTKNLILLQTNANLVHILHKQGFSPASCEDFLQFLRSKGLKVK